LPPGGKTDGTGSRPVRRNPPVDQQLIEALKHSHQDQAVLRALDRVSGNGKSPYEKYEQVRQLLDSGQLSAAFHSTVEDTLPGLGWSRRLCVFDLPILT
jgi:hypothetical protein